MSKASPTSTPAGSSPPLSSIPIADRPGPTKWPQLVAFVALFLFAMLMEHGTQLLLWPLAFHPRTQPTYERGIAYTKRAFGQNLCLISQLFAPSTLVLSFGDESGRLLDPEAFVEREGGAGGGRVTGVRLPDRSVLISNHQIYLDWLYIWILAYYASLADAIYIVLKASLKWTPIVGPAMQFYRFIFMARKWDDDKKNLANQLAYLAERSKPWAGTSMASALARTSADSSVDGKQVADPGAAAAPNKLLFIIFPEGTLVSDESRPGSKKYAEKIGQPDCVNMVLPRSTGLFFCLRTLGAEVADLRLVDVAMGYPGIPPAGVGQRHYTLRSVYMDGVPPPAVHLHLTISRIASFVPHGSDSPPLGALPRSARDSPNKLPTEEEKAAFEAWLLRRWRRKDEMLERFYREGDFVGGAFARTAAAGEYRRRAPIELPSAPNGQALPQEEEAKKPMWVELKTELRSNLEIGHVFCWFAPLIAIYLVIRLWRLVGGLLA